MSGRWQGESRAQVLGNYEGRVGMLWPYEVAVYEEGGMTRGCKERMDA